MLTLHRAFTIIPPVGTEIRLPGAFGTHRFAIAELDVDAESGPGQWTAVLKAIDPPSFDDGENLETCLSEASKNGWTVPRIESKQQKAA